MKASNHGKCENQIIDEQLNESCSKLNGSIINWVHGVPSGIPSEQINNLNFEMECRVDGVGDTNSTRKNNNMHQRSMRCRKLGGKKR